MNEIPTKLSKDFFETHILPFLTIAKRGFVSKIALYLIFNGILYKLYSGCQWKSLPTKEFIDPENDIELSYQAFYYHFRKWSNDESFMYVFKASIIDILIDINVEEINLDGTHTLAKKGGEKVEYQRRKRGKTSNIFPVTDKNGNVIGYLPILSGNHNDAYELEERLNDFFHELKWLKDFSITFEGTYLNADSGFDTKKARKVCFNHKIIPNIKENPRGRKKEKKGRKRLFDQQIYNNRFVCERSYAWHDKFRSLIIRYDKKEIYWLAQNLIVFAMTNFRYLTN